MVSYYNTLPYSQKHTAANLAYPAGQPWQWTPNYHTPPNHQFLGEMDSAHAHHQMYYNPHHMFHSAAAGAAATDWHSPTPSAENFPQNAPIAHQMLQQHQHHGNGGGGSSSSASSGSSSASAGVPTSGNTQLNETASSIGEQHIAEGLPSPPITVSGSEISSPGAPASSSSPHHGSHHLNQNNNNSPSANNNNNTTAHNNNRSSPVKAQYYDWMKKPSYPAQPTPGTYTDAELCTTPSLEDFTELLDSSGKTRTKDKYRVVYTDYQRLELEKEYCTSRYITIRRKTELAQSLSLSERQVKIWFQNRRAKERKQNKKGNDPTSMGGVQHSDYPNLMDTKPKLEPGLQHSLHSLHSMAAMTMPSMSLHHHLHSHHPLAVGAHSHQLHHSHQSPHAAQMSAAAAAASVGSLSM